MSVEMLFGSPCVHIAADQSNTGSHRFNPHQAGTTPTPTTCLDGRYQSTWKRL